MSLGLVRAHSTDTIKRRGTDRSVNVGHFVIEIKPASERIYCYLNDQGCTSQYRHGWSVVDWSRASQSGSYKVVV